MFIRYSVALAALAGFLLHEGAGTIVSAKNYSRYVVEQTAEASQDQPPTLKRRRLKPGQAPQPAEGSEKAKPSLPISPPEKSAELKKKQNLKSIFELVEEEAKASREKQEQDVRELDTYEIPAQPPRKKRKTSKRRVEKNIFSFIEEGSRKSNAEPNKLRRKEIASTDKDADKKRGGAAPAQPNKIVQPEVPPQAKVAAEAQQKPVKRKKKPAAETQVAVVKAKRGRARRGVP